MVGITWVVASFLVLAYLLLSAVLLFTAVVGSDVGTILAELPSDPEAILGEEVCRNVDISNSSLNLCRTLSNCFGESSTLVESAMKEASIQVLNTTYVNNLVTESESSRSDLSSKLDTLVEGYDRMASSLTEIQTLSAGDFGLTTSSPGYDEVALSLEELRGNLSDAVTRTAPAIQAGLFINATAPRVTSKVYDLAEGLNALDAATTCDWIKPAYNALVDPLSDVFTNGMPALAIALGIGAIFLIWWIVTAIMIQIRFGDVGREPGCPSKCRCCCPPPTQRGAKRVIKMEQLEVSIDGPTTAV